MQNRKLTKLIARVLIVLMAVFSITCSGLGADTAYAGTDTLSIKVGFYGGPYYEVKLYDDSDMRAMADDTVWTYTGVDGGNFMRVCYAWGVPLELVLANADIDLGSVNYLHFGTTDRYEEVVTTFTASSLLAERYFFPDMVNAAGSVGYRDVPLDYDLVTSDITSEAYTVPTILAIGSSDFTKDEAKAVIERGGYQSPAKSELDEDHKYRLIFGQLGLESSGQAYNVQTSDKWVYEINVQLDGSPDIVVEKELLSGEDGLVGSSYKVKVNVELPDSYDYIDSEIRAKLEQQVLEKVTTDYDSSKVKLTETGTGEYEMEILEEGESDINFSYSRTEYNGSTTTASGKTTVTGSYGSGDDNSGNDEESDDDSSTGDNGGSGESSETGSGDENGSSENGTESDDSSDDGDSSGSNDSEDNNNKSGKTNKTDSEETDKGINIAKNKTNKKINAIAKNYKKNNSKTTDDDSSSGVKWQSTELAGTTGETQESSVQSNGGAMLGAGLGIIFCLGVAAPIVDFYRNTYKGSKIK